MRVVLWFSVIVGAASFGPRAAFAQDVTRGQVPSAASAAPSMRSPDPAGAARDGHPPDRARIAALIASPIVLGIGGAVSGVAYLVLSTQEHDAAGQCTSNPTDRTTECVASSAPALAAYDSIMAIVPSMPRWVVGDWTGALVYTGLRGASVMAASFIHWGPSTSASALTGPLVFGFVLPTMLAVADLATTPHREDLAATRGPTAKSGASVSRIAAAPLGGLEHRVTGAEMTLGGTF